MFSAMLTGTSGGLTPHELLMVYKIFVHILYWASQFYVFVNWTIFTLIHLCYVSG